jgi:hypothetical protein
VRGPSVTWLHALRACTRPTSTASARPAHERGTGTGGAGGRCRLDKTKFFVNGAGLFSGVMAYVPRPPAAALHGHGITSAWPAWPSVS